MQHHLALTEPAFRTIAERLVADPFRPLTLPAGLNRTADRIEWLVADHDQFAPRETNRAALVAVASNEVSQLRAAAVAALRTAERDQPVAVLAMGVGSAVGHLTALCRSGTTSEPIDSLTITGPGLPRVAFASPDRVDSVPTRDPTPGSNTRPTNSQEATAPRVVWSRTIGALGEETWRRLTDLHVGVIGCGRAGSLVARGHAHVGGRRLTLIDDDVLEPHNLGEMDGVGTSDLGSAKVHALAKNLEQSQRTDTASALDVTAVAESVLSLAALAAVKEVDVLFCCVDQPAARMAAAFLASLYLIPLLDIGTGIFHDPGAPTTRRMGADVRLVAPGRCLLCLGGLAGLQDARSEILSPVDRPTDPDLWRRQRAGSLRSLNSLGVNLAFRLLEDFVEGRLRESTWIHLNVGHEGIPVLEHRRPPRPRTCRLCSLAGSGDHRVHELRNLLDQ